MLGAGVPGGIYPTFKPLFMILFGDPRLAP